MDQDAVLFSGSRAFSLYKKNTAHDSVLSVEIVQGVKESKNKSFQSQQIETS